MATLNLKDANRLETQRYLIETDPPYYSVFNRALEDLNQRTVDINNIFVPARGLHVHQASTPDLTVEVSNGWYMADESNPVLFPSGATTSLTVPIATPGFIRIDLVYFDLENGAVGRSAGTEVAATAGFATVFDDATPKRGVLPPNSGMIPLAYLYVDADPSMVFSDTILINNAGYIRDCRLAPGAGLRVFEGTVGNLKTDVANGDVGSEATIARSDHQHPLNVSASLPTIQVTYPSTSDVGTADTYARRDHIHALDMETSIANLLPDAGVVGSAGQALTTTYARSDHQHDVNLGTTPPGSLVAGTPGSAGTGQVYVRNDHEHEATYGAGLTPGNIKTLNWSFNLYQMSWTPGTGTRNTGAFPWEPIFAIFIWAGNPNPANAAEGCHGVGYAIPGTAFIRSTATRFLVNAGSPSWTAASSVLHPGGFPTANLGYATTYSGILQLQNFDQAGGLTLKPTTGSVNMKVSILVAGLVEHT
jgi:hypothetical protein